MVEAITELVSAGWGQPAAAARDEISDWEAYRSRRVVVRTVTKISYRVSSTGHLWG